MQTTVRRGTLEDVETIAQFNAAMARETEDKKLDPDTVRRGVRRLMEQPDNGFYVVAEQESEVVGALMITTEWSDWRDGRFWWLQSVYVRPRARRQGVFSTLYEHVSEQARRCDDVCGLRLYMERDNDIARAAYEELGLVRTRYHMYEKMLPS